MEKYLLSDPVSNVFNRVCGVQKRLRSIMLGYCNEIDRYFNIKIGVNIDNDIEQNDLDTIKEYFPNFENIDLATFKKMINVFRKIRNVSAHLYYCEDIDFDIDVRFYLEKITAPALCVHKKGKFTMFGIAYFLVFLMQKFNVWPFVTEYFTHEVFNEVPKKGIDKLKKGFLSEFINAAGIGKPIEIDGMKTMVSNFMNDVNRRWIISIFFDIEDIIKKNNPNIVKGWSFYKTISMEPDFINATGFVEKIRELRNSLFHGYGLFDIVTNVSRTFCMDLIYITDILNDLKNICLKNQDKYRFVLTDIYFYAKAMFHFYYLRSVEVAYKLIDNRLLTVDKVDSRIKNSIDAYNHTKDVSDDVIKAISRLITFDDIEWNMSLSKFTDFKERFSKLRTLELIHIKSDNGFQIGEFKSDEKEMYLCNVTLEKEYQNKICGKYLDEYPRKLIKKICDYIEIVEIEIK